jgi:hypothetical protein
MNPETVNTIETILAAAMLGIPAAFAAAFLVELIHMEYGRK